LEKGKERNPQSRKSIAEGRRQEGQNIPKNQSKKKPGRFGKRKEFKEEGKKVLENLNCVNGGA